MLDDEQAESFRAFVAGQRTELRRTAYLLTGDVHAADDLTQAVLLKVATRWDRVKATQDPVAYVRRILYNTHVSLWRRLRNREVSQPEVAESAERSAEDDVLARIELRRALSRLAVRQRVVLVLRFYEDMSEQQAAAVLGCSVGTIKSQTHRALKRLRESAPELADLMGVPSRVEATL